MCSKKIFGGHKPKADPPPAVQVAAPTASNDASSMFNQGETNAQAKGKRKLTINRVDNIGTGVNI